MSGVIRSASAFDPGAGVVVPISFDLLFRGLEIVTGGQPHHRYEDYVEAPGGEVDAFEGHVEAFPALTTLARWRSRSGS